MSEIKNTNDKASTAVAANVLVYNDATIQHKVRADKYTGAITESYGIVCASTGAKFSIKSGVMLELAYLESKNDSFTLLLRNGYEGNGKMSAGSGIALKMTKQATFYECTFYTGEIGKAFDPKKVQGKDYIRFDKDHLGALFTFLRCDEEVRIATAEASKIERASLELD